MSGTEKWFFEIEEYLRIKKCFWAFAAIKNVAQEIANLPQPHRIEYHNSGVVLMEWAITHSDGYVDDLALRLTASPSRNVDYISWIRGWPDVIGTIKPSDNCPEELQKRFAQDPPTIEELNQAKKKPEKSKKKQEETLFE